MRICPHCKRKYENAETRFCPEDGQPLVEQSNFTAQSQPQTKAAARSSAAPAAPISASLAVMFFPLAFLPPSHVGSWGLGAFINVIQPAGAAVHYWQLGEKLLTVSLWFLQRNNLIRFALGAPRKSFLSAPHTPLIVEVNHANAQKIPGLEFDLLETARRSAPGIGVDELVMAHLTKYESHNPLEPIYERMTQWVLHLGYGQPVVKTKSWVPLRGKVRDFEFEPDLLRIARLETSAQAVQREWVQFQNQQPQLADKIYKEVDLAIRKRTHSSD